MINLTLLIQVTHFWVAYLILDRILLRPGIALIRKEDCETASLQRKIDEITDELAARAVQKEQEWRIFQHSLQQQKPMLEYAERVPMERVETEKFKPFPAQDIAELVQQMQKLMVNRIAYD